jgi:hypothetical protein
MNWSLPIFTMVIYDVKTFCKINNPGDRLGLFNWHGQGHILADTVRIPTNTITYMHIHAHACAFILSKIRIMPNTSQFQVPSTHRREYCPKTLS